MGVYIRRVNKGFSYERLERLRNLERFSLDSKHWMPLQTCFRMCRIPGIQKRHEKWCWFVRHGWWGFMGWCGLLRSAEHVQRNESNNRFSLLEVRSALSGAAGFFKPIRKVAHISPKVPHRVCIISICSILILLSILRSLTQSYVHPHHMKTQFSKLLTNVGAYALTYPKSTDILKYITVNASWVNTEMDSNPTVLFYWKKSGLNPVDKVAHTYTTGFKNHVY